MTDTTTTEHNMDFDVRGMTCASCAARVEKTLQRHDGVRSAEVNFAAGTARVLGRYFEARAKRRAGAAIRALLELGAKEARVIRDDGEVMVPVEQVAVGDLLRVRPGEKIPTDGEVVQGQARSTSPC